MCKIQLINIIYVLLIVSAFVAVPQAVLGSEEEKDNSSNLESIVDKLVMASGDCVQPKTVESKEVDALYYFVEVVYCCCSTANGRTCCGNTSTCPSNAIPGCFCR